MRMVLFAAVASLVIAGAASADYYTDWSDGDDGWVGSGSGTTAFTLTDGVWFAPDLSGPSSDYLTSPVFYVDDALNLSFDFLHCYDMETNYDGGVIEISVNGGGFTYFVMGDYDATISSSFESPIAGLDAYTGSNIVPHLSGNIIAGLTNGDTLEFRFHQGDDNSVGDDGWYIGDFGVYGASIPAPGALALLGLAGLAGRRRRR